MRNIWSLVVVVAALIWGFLPVAGWAQSTTISVGVIYDYDGAAPPNPFNSWYGAFTVSSTDPFCPIGARSVGGHPVGGLSVWRKDLSTNPPTLTQITIPEDSVSTFFTITDTFSAGAPEPYVRTWLPILTTEAAHYMQDAPLVPAWRVGDVGHFHISKSNSPGTHVDTPACFAPDRSTWCDCQHSDPNTTVPCTNLSITPPPVACNLAP